MLSSEKLCTMSLKDIYTINRTCEKFKPELNIKVFSGLMPQDRKRYR